MLVCLFPLSFICMMIFPLIFLFYLFVLQVLGESLYIIEKYLDYEEKISVAQSKVDSLFYENVVLKTKVQSLSNNVGIARDRLKTLERKVNTSRRPSPN